MISFISVPMSCWCARCVAGVGGVCDSLRVQEGHPLPGSALLLLAATGAAGCCAIQIIHSAVWQKCEAIILIHVHHSLMTYTYFCTISSFQLCECNLGCRCNLLEWSHHKEINKSILYRVWLPHWLKTMSHYLSDSQVSCCAQVGAMSAPIIDAQLWVREIHIVTQMITTIAVLCY